MKPWPRLGGMTKIVASHVGIPSHIEDKHIPPINMQTAPSTCGGFIRPVYVMKKPVDTANIVNNVEGAANRKPDIDAESNLTAWKYNGALKTTVLMPI